MIFILFLILISLLIWKWWQDTKLVPNFPPGPWGVPFLGHLGTIVQTDFLEGFESLHAKYGKVCSANLGPGNRMVIIADYEVMKNGKFFSSCNY